MTLAPVLILAVLHSDPGSARVEPILGRTRYEVVSLAPDGRRALAVMVQDGTSLTGESRVLRVLDLEDGSRASLPLEGGRYGYFCWSPDSQRVAFLRWGSGFTEIWTYTPGAGAPACLLDPLETRQVFGLEWRRDEGFDALFVVRTESSGFAGGRDVVLSCYHLEPGTWGPEIGRIQGLYVAEATLAHDGSALAVVAAVRPPAGAAGGPLDLYRLDLPAGELHRLTAGDGIAAHPVWSHDDRQLVCIWTPGPDLLSTRKREIVRFDRDGARRDLTAGFGLSIGDGIYGADECVWFSTSGEEVLVATERGTGDHLLAVNVESGESHWLTSGVRSFKGLCVARHGACGLTVLSDPGLPECLALHDLEQQTFAIIERPNDALEGLLGPFQEVHFEAADGLPLEGILVTPPSSSPPYPTVVSLHGGSSGRNTARFNEALAQLYAARGFATFLPNPRGSAGYGQDFVSREGTPFGGAEVEDVLRGVQVLTERGLADADRLFLQGYSYGAYLAAMVASRSHCFRAIAATAGVYDWETFHATSDLPELAVQGLGGPPEERREAYHEASPLYLVSRMDTPLLLVHGREDRRIPVDQSRRFYEALKQQGVEADLLLSFDEHQIRGATSLRVWFDALYSWFHAHDRDQSR